MLDVSPASRSGRRRHNGAHEDVAERRESVPCRGVLPAIRLLEIIAAGGGVFALAAATVENDRDLRVRCKFAEKVLVQVELIARDDEQVPCHTGAPVSRSMVTRAISTRSAQSMSPRT